MIVRAALATLLLIGGFAVIAAGPAAASAGDPTLRSYFIADPMSHAVSIPRATLDETVGVEDAITYGGQHLVAAVEAFTAPKTHDEFLDLLVEFPATNLPNKPAIAREITVSVCHGIYGTLLKLADLTLISGARRGTCTLEIAGKTLDDQVIGAVRGNVVEATLGTISSHLSVAKFDSASIHQYRLLPAGGVALSTPAS